MDDTGDISKALNRLVEEYIRRLPERKRNTAEKIAKQKIRIRNDWIGFILEELGNQYFF